MKPIDRFTCAEMLRRLDDYLDRQLDEKDLRLVEEHLESCVRCAAEYRFEKQLIEQVRQKLGRVALPKEVAERLRKRLRDAN